MEAKNVYNVLSLLLSLIGTWVGTKEITIEPFKNSLHIWPRNFGVAFWIELLIAQPKITSKSGP